jgi:formamidopyrimidine-DNA glycosylase
MPELPEVETVRRGLAPICIGQRVQRVIVRDGRLRWPVPADLPTQLAAQTIQRLERRGKYLLFQLERGTLLVHLGMTGKLRCFTTPPVLTKHDHLDLQLTNGSLLRFNDPRRFGAVLYASEPYKHPLIAALGVEPLSDDFTGAYLHHLTRNRRVPLKVFIMDAHQVVGVGNIYANEALFRAGIRPQLLAGKLSRPRAETLVAAIKAVLTEAIAAGGSTLRDYVDGFGQPGWFQLNYFVYGRAGEACRVCGTAIQLSRTGGRATTWCPRCQK